MRMFGRVATLAGALALALPAAAYADGFKSWRLCGGSHFTTCASVQVTVVGSSVTVQVWNLSGNTGATYGASSNVRSIFNGIGFYNVPPGISANTASLAVSGPARPGDSPGNWKLRNDASVAFFVDMTATTTGLNNGIASGCATAADLPGSPPHLYMNPCSSNLNSAGYVTFSFQITGGTWDPANADITLRAYDGIQGGSTECWTGTSAGGQPSNCTTVTPEPVTMTLLASGLAGMGGVGFLRRRRKNEVA